MRLADKKKPGFPSIRGKEKKRVNPARRGEGPKSGGKEKVGKANGSLGGGYRRMEAWLRDRGERKNDARIKASRTEWTGPACPKPPQF